MLILSPHLSLLAPRGKCDADTRRKLGGHLGLDRHRLRCLPPARRHLPELRSTLSAAVNEGIKCPLFCPLPSHPQPEFKQTNSHGYRHAVSIHTIRHRLPHSKLQLRISVPTPTIMRILESPLVPLAEIGPNDLKDAPSPEFSPLAFAEELSVPLPIYKAAQTSNFDISGLLSTPLRLHEDLTSGCGGQTWPAGMVLAKHMLRYHREDMKNARM